jgi:hypothetical protein
MAFYRKLKHNEVRMLTIVDAPKNSNPDLVHCKLEHVSLDDITPEWKKFLAEEGRPFDSGSLKEWLRQGSDGKYTKSKWPTNKHMMPKWLRQRSDGTHRKMFNNQVHLPRWRYDCQYSTEELIIERLDGTIEEMAVAKNKLDAFIISLQFLGPITPPTLPRARTPPQLSYDTLHPRFNWGDFEAISYCWESDIRTHTIVIENNVFPVPYNLWALLQRLRKLPETRAGMKYWIDALCIDQCNTSEKNCQVPLMKSIYRKAFAVITWLGEETEESEKAMHFILAIFRQYFLTWGHGNLGVVLKDMTPTKERYFLDLPWQALHSFLSRSYWRRLWIIQELVLNHNMTLFLCGKSQLSRRMISGACRFVEVNIDLIDRLVSPRLNLARLATSSVYVSLWDIVWHIDALINYSNQSQKRELEDILDLSRKANVTDSRDKIYGVLGLLPTGIASAISPDYTTSNTFAQVYEKFAKKLIQKTDHLHHVLFWCSYDSKNGLPSWVPDWRSEFRRNKDKVFMNCKASGDSTYSTYVISKKKKNVGLLGARSIMVDFVASASISTSKNTINPLEVQVISKSRDYSNASHIYGSKVPEALARTLTMNHPGSNWDNATIFDIFWTSEKPPAMPEALDIVRANSTWIAFESFRLTNSEFSIFGRRFRDFFPSSKAFHSKPILTNLHAANMRLSMIAQVGRRLITTKNGYLGLAPEEVEVNDVVAILFGCKFPVILRPSGQNYVYIGECYVDGLMDGEILQPGLASKYEEVDITIC